MKLKITLYLVNFLLVNNLDPAQSNNFFDYRDTSRLSSYTSHLEGWHISQTPEEVPSQSKLPKQSTQNFKRLHRQPFQVINEWKYLDFTYPTYVQRQRAIANGEFIPENNLPLGVDIYGNKLFITTPRWKDGVPASFGTVPYPPKERSPAITPYPDWDSHGDPYNPDCSKLISVYRTSIDTCGRIWLIDSGIVNATVSLNQICPPKIIAYDLVTDFLVISYELPPNQVKQDSLHSNILVEVQNQRCDDAYVYITDVWRYGIVVYSLKKNRSWRITNFKLNPNPVASDFNIYGLNFQWLDGVFGMSLSLDQSQVNSNNERFMYFHAMASYKEFMVPTALLRDENLWLSPPQNVSKYFVEIGDRGTNGQSSTSGIDRNGVMFFTMVHQDNIGCWDTTKQYTRNNLMNLIQNFNGENNTHSATLIQFPNDLKVDEEPVQGVWVMSNQLPIYLYSQLDFSTINFRILRADAKDAVTGTICDPMQTSSNDITTALVQEGQCF